MKSRKMRLAGHAARMGERREVHRVLVGKSEGNNHLEDPGIDGKDNIKTDIQDLGWGHRVD